MIEIQKSLRENLNWTIGGTTPCDREEISGIQDQIVAIIFGYTE